MTNLSRVSAGLRRALERPPLNVVVPPVALLHRRAKGRWWTEVEASAAEADEYVYGDEGTQTLADGVGDVLTRRYQIDLSDASRSPQDVVDAFRADPDRFSPTSYASFGTDRLEPGATTTVRLAGPWNGPVEVVEHPSGGVRLLTRSGHMEAGWIDFVAVDDPAPAFRIQSTARAGDPGFWLLHDVLPVGRWVQTDMWARVAEAAATFAGIDEPPRVQVSTWRHDGGSRQEAPDADGDPLND